MGRRSVVSVNPLKFAPTYTWFTYGEVDIKRRHIGSAIHSLFNQGILGGGEFQTVGIWAPNCPGMYLCTILRIALINTRVEWQIVDIALQTYQKVSVSLYDTLGKDSVGKCTFPAPVNPNAYAGGSIHVFPFILSSFYRLTAINFNLVLSMPILPSSSQHLSIFHFC